MQLSNREQLLRVAEPWRSRRRLALELVERTLASLDPYASTLESLQTVFPRGAATDSWEFVVFALGKAAGPMARAALDYLEPTAGYVLSPAEIPGLAPPPGRPTIVQLVGSHPTPSPDAPEQARRVLSALRALDSRHHLVCLISGGGSSLLELPRAGVSLEELSQTSERLMNAGADIQALNVVRRALSQVKGGGLLRASGTQRVTNFILSDVVLGPLYAVASGPTLPVTEPAQSARQILEDFGVRDALPSAVVAALDRAVSAPSSSATEPLTTPPTWLVADNERGVRLLVEHAATVGVKLQVQTQPLQGDAAQTGADLAGRISARQSVSGIAMGGETTVRLDVTEPGAGGRNQELILGAARAALRDGGFSGTLVSFGSDGIDGQSPAAGALLDQAVLATLDTSQVEQALARHDSYSLLEDKGAALISGATGTNVADLLFWLPE
ncbi:MAG: DUF4147 domain-containing protein [Polyangiaceae bacterium]|nr:DUF4147 domain-containing protein [Polyangiaceae bacterium]MCB9608527.1 DUF4147 domain-containing protein [Polyangiaceae bacterium]